MRDSRLSELNFKEIVDYGGQPPVENYYETPLHCTGYCISCEETGRVAASGGTLDLMSHGCDSSDFEAILGPLPSDSPAPGRVTEPVIFLLQDPGREVGIGKVVAFQGYRKLPPVNHYYWTPQPGAWPRGPQDFDGNFYGPYFAYLMWRHQLTNVYITNVTKCRFKPRSPASDGIKASPQEIIAHCAERYLRREFAFVRPEQVVCFGGAVQSRFKAFCQRADIALRHKPIVLYHPSYIANKWQTWPGQTQQSLIDENDQAMARAFAQPPAPSGQ